MGRLDKERTTLSKGVVGRGLKIVGKFSGMAALPPPPMPGLTAVPKVMPAQKWWPRSPRWIRRTLSRTQVG